MTVLAPLKILPFPSSSLDYSYEKTGYSVVHRWVTAAVSFIDRRCPAMLTQGVGGFPTVEDYLIPFVSLYLSLVLSKALLPMCVSSISYLVTVP